MIVLETKDNAIKEKQNLMLKNKEIHDQNKKVIFFLQ